ncbi:hypothetical protein BKA63DRAFT_534445 [Paraphoma chrysanthemicola]|nr:hypothetical protein BKA63DRAFT_534445 [Paraphoma chrysanthemicola]
MKTTSIFTAAVAILLQTHPVRAGPITQLLPRAKVNVADIAGLIAAFFGIKDILADEPELAWDYKTFNHLCAVHMETHNGANCKATVTCDDGVKEYNAAGVAWNVCYIGGRQFFTDPRIGEFSITFTEKDGESQGQGLTTPILQVKYVNNSMEIPVNDLALQYQNYQDCSESGGLGGSPFRQCDEGPFLCHYGNMGNKYIHDSRTKKWECGIPKVGKGVGDFNSDGPSNSKGYRPGWCGAHVIQYQKPDPSKDQYSLAVTAVNDANENSIGSFPKGGPTASVTSLLPLTLEVKTGGVDTDPVQFAYGAQSWSSNDAGRCSVGKYDSGKREMDCGFTCE